LVVQFFLLWFGDVSCGGFIEFAISPKNPAGSIEQDSSWQFWLRNFQKKWCSCHHHLNS